MARRLTAFERFLVRHGACSQAREFVASHGGSFTRAWRASKRDDWRRWLAVRLDAPLCDCSACFPGGQAAFRRKQAREVFAAARKRRWVR